MEPMKRGVRAVAKITNAKAIPTLELKPWDGLRAVLPPLASYDIAMLTESIIKHGVLRPIFALPDGRIIDGYYRWIISKIWGRKVPFKVLDVSEPEAFELGIVLNTGRRNMSHKQMREVLNKTKGLKKYVSRIPALRVSIPRKEYEKIYQRSKSGVCVSCGSTAREFRDERSMMMFGISGMCQKCQNETFGRQGGECDG